MKIKITVEGGIVQSVESDDPENTHVQVYDIDNIKAGDEEPDDFAFPIDKLEERSS